MKLLVSGANGFIGSHLLKYFSQTGDYDVWGLVRKTSNLFRLEGDSYRLLRASLNDQLDPLLRGFDAVIHTAALASDWGCKEDFYRTNVDGTLNILNASIRCGVERFVYLSSTVLYGFGGHRNTTEEQEGRPFPNSYCITKTIAEQKVLKQSKEMKLFVLRPSNVYGPWDTNFTLPLLRGIDRGLFGFPAGGRFFTSPCYVKNLVSAVERTLKSHGPFGEVFNITDGKDIPWIEFLRIIAGQMGSHLPRLSIPVGPLSLISALLETLYRGFKSKKPPLITRYRVAQAGSDYSFSIRKAKQVLTYTPPYSTQEGVRESILWYNAYAEKIR
jgi:nucleoside-diphosphate-sugar epimerase